MTLSDRQKAEQLYSDRGLGGKLVPGRKFAVLVVDLIKGFTDPSFPAGSDLNAVVDATLQLLHLARAQQVPVIYTTIAYTPAMQVTNRWLEKMPAMRGLLEGSPWVEVDARLEKTDDEMVLIKRGASAFFGTDLSSHLIAQGVDSLLICGATTSGCIRASVVDGCMLGFNCFVPYECVGDRVRAPHDANLFDIQAKYGEVISLEAALAFLIGTEKG
jgi:maleamate amidohydrolase